MKGEPQGLPQLSRGCPSHYLFLDSLGYILSGISTNLLQLNITAQGEINMVILCEEKSHTLE